MVPDLGGSKARQWPLAQKKYKGFGWKITEKYQKLRERVISTPPITTGIQAKLTEDESKDGYKMNSRLKELL